jgi:hypothetical protein
VFNNPISVAKIEPESGLSANVPELDGDVAFGDLSHVEADGGDHVLVELAGSDDVDECRFSGVLEPDLSRRRY